MPTQTLTNDDPDSSGYQRRSVLGALTLILAASIAVFADWFSQSDSGPRNPAPDNPNKANENDTDGDSSDPGDDADDDTSDGPNDTTDDDTGENDDSFLGYGTVYGESYTGSTSS